MFDEEENNDFPSAGTIMGAILRKQRELPWIFGNIMEREGITEDEPSATAGDDIKREIFKKMFGKEEFEEDITDDESSTSTKDDEALEINVEQEVVFEEKEQKKSTTDDGSSVLPNKRTLKSTFNCGTDQQLNKSYSRGKTMEDARNPHYGTCSSIHFQDGPKTYSNLNTFRSSEY